MHLMVSVYQIYLCSDVRIASFVGLDDFSLFAKTPIWIMNLCTNLLSEYKKYIVVLDYVT